MEGGSSRLGQGAYPHVADYNPLCRSSDTMSIAERAPNPMSKEKKITPMPLRNIEKKGLGVQFGSIMAMISCLMENTVELSEKSQASYVS